MQTLIQCPHCKKEFDLPDAFTHQIEEKVLGDQQRKHEEELSLMKKQLVDAQKIELELRKQKNELDEEKRTFELTKQRQLDAEREKIRAKTAEEIMESQRLKDKEKDKVIDDLKKSLEDAQRKATQGSQQLQGEVAELDLEELLKNEFTDDVIEPIGKGVLGADIRQIVRSRKGHPCGKILWESKRTKAWSDGWISKLKEDLRNDVADIPIIVSSQLPEEAKSGFGFKEGVYIVSPVLIVPIAETLRQRLIEIAREKYISLNKGEKAYELHAYITSQEFRQHLEALAEVYQEMRQQIDKERVAFERIWKAREVQVEKMFKSTSRIVGSMQGIVGTALPTIKNLELEGSTS